MIIKRIINLGIITTLSLSLVSCAAMPVAPANDTATTSDVEEIKKRIEELKKENEQLKEEVSPAQNDEEIVLEDSGTEDDHKEAEYAAENDTDIPSTWTDDMVIEFSDPIVEKYVRKESNVSDEGDITYGMVKNITDLCFLPIEEVFPHNIDELKYFTNLEYIVINIKEIEDISVLERLPALKKVHVGNANTNDLKVLRNCKNLEYLNLWFFADRDLSILADFPNLTFFGFLNYVHEQENKPRDFSVLKELPKLEQVYISLNNVDLSFVGGLHDVKELRLQFMYTEDMGALKGLSNLKNLEHFWIEYYTEETISRPIYYDFEIEDGELKDRHSDLTLQEYLNSL